MQAKLAFPLTTQQRYLNLAMIARQCSQRPGALDWTGQQKAAFPRPGNIMVAIIAKDGGLYNVRQTGPGDYYWGVRGTARQSFWGAFPNIPFQTEVGELCKRQIKELYHSILTT